MIEKDHPGDWSPEKDSLFATNILTTCAEAILQSQVIVLIARKFKNPGERFDLSIDIAVRRVLLSRVSKQSRKGILLFSSISLETGS